MSSGSGEGDGTLGAAAAAELRERLAVAEDTLEAIRTGAVDALVVAGEDGDKLFTLAGADSFFRTLIEEMPEGAVVLDPKGVVVYANQRMALLLDAPLERVTGEIFARFIPEDNRELLRRALAGGRQGRMAELETLCALSGRSVPVAISIRAMPEEEGGGHCLIATDLSALQRADRARLEAQERFERAFEDAPIGMALLDLDGRFNEANEALCAISGHPRGRLERLTLAEVTHPLDAPATAEGLTLLRDGHLDVLRLEERLIDADGDEIWVALQVTLVRDAAGAPVRYLVQVQDISEQRDHEDRLAFLADHDPLTGLLNRRSFSRDLDSHAARGARYGAEGALLVFDLDHFKYVNDTSGHQAGDVLIARVATVVKSRLREADALARLGGDEFAILLPRADAKEAQFVAEALLEAIRDEPVLVAGSVRRRLSASFGIALFEAGQTGEDVLVNADLAMYDAKEGGRDRVCAHPAASDGTQGVVRDRITWAERIGAAFEEDRFTLYAQPIVDLGSGEATQHELLVRMVGDDGELVQPETFLRTAERLDLVQRLDSWVVSQAFDLLASEALVVGGALEINLSARTIGDRGLLELIDEKLETSGVDPSRLVFEITETAAIENMQAARVFGRHLSERGCRFALDDFGAGFGSFMYLKLLPFDFIKIDGEFVRSSVRNATDRLVIEAVVGIARGLGKLTVGEFIEDAPTLTLLRQLGVNFGQGYHLGEPVPVGEIFAPPAQA
jgi:diguanylate cyclase (GGDEF)-like protein/PAS domain S-box-containing protein